MNVEVSPVRRVLFIIALLALVLGGPVPGAAAMMPAMAEECLGRCGATDQERATLPPCCAAVRNCQVKSSGTIPYAGTSRRVLAATKNPVPGRDPRPPSLLAGMFHRSPQVLARNGERRDFRRPIVGRPETLSRICVLRL